MKLKSNWEMTEINIFCRCCNEKIPSFTFNCDCIGKQNLKIIKRPKRKKLKK
jgi:hypothetical protein